MGIHNLSWICLAVFSVSALAADPPVPRSNVSVTVNPTTSYYTVTNSTVRLPSGVSISPSSASVPVVSKYQGGMQQTIPTGITIDAIQKSAPLPAVVRAKTSSINNAAKTLLRGNLVGLALGAGLTALLDGIGALIDDSGRINIPDDAPLGTVPPPSDYKQTWRANMGYNDTRTACEPMSDNASVLACFPKGTNWEGKMTYGIYQCAHVINGYSLSGTLAPSRYGDYGYCYYGGSSTISRPMIPASPEFIDEAVDNSYTADPSDWTSLTPHLELDDVEITWAPTLESNPKTTTIYDADGNPVEVQETNIWYDFDIRDNPSPSPALDLKTRQETKTYKNGQLTGTTSTTDTASAGAAGGGGGSNVNIDIPTDCEFMPTVCAFLDWFKNDDSPDDPDLSALIDNRDFTETYSITGGSKQCPADYEFTVDFIGRTYGLSFEPACDFASKIYYFVMAAAYIFAAYITIGASRNG